LIATLGCRLNKSTLSTAVFNFACIRVLDLTATGDAERAPLTCIHKHRQPCQMTIGQRDGDRSRAWSACSFAARL